MKILFFGDIVGKVGRRAMVAVLPELKNKYAPDVILANAENLAHGKGVTVKTLLEMKNLGIDGFTSGNHVWKKENVLDAKKQAGAFIATPLNDLRTPHGHGYFQLQVGSVALTVVNLLGRVFITEPDLSCPFKESDRFIDEYSSKGPIIMDFHAEATSEKVALGWYLDGRISAVFGTHTHIPTADLRILPKGTAYVTDIGMVGPANSVLGVKKELIIEKFLTDGPIVFKYDESGEAEINAVYLEINNATGRAARVEKISQLVYID